MAQDKKPVIVTLVCEATPQVDTQEIDRTEWEAMTPAERLALIQDAADTHMTNAGGYGWGIDDPDDAAMVGDSVPNPLRELAEWLATEADERRFGSLHSDQAVLDEAIVRARKALGRKED